ncbi:MAG: single-stranded-DNA-specific exonuclease RecJ, partial [Selenomonadales bacterium]|nr:single-stranded-DNA-specific exonuclease RecJ [Selenomonadales bacterium]
GVDLIITDHHQPLDILPNAYVVINPKQEGCDYPEKMLAGVGVAFKLCQALWQTMRNEELMRYYDLVALGTVADIVPLVGENRAFVQRGLSEMKMCRNKGMYALMQVSQIEPALVTAGHVSFRLAPRLNAAGRLGQAESGVELLLADDDDRCCMIAEELNAENEERQRIEKEILEEAVAVIEEKKLADDHVIVVSGEGWHGGVIGIVASRIVERYYRPTIVITTEDGMGKGSCRSISGFDILDALKAGQDILTKFGGHKQAAGLGIEASKIDEFRIRMNEYAKDYADDDIWRPQVKIDAVIAPTEVDEQLVRSLDMLEPFGMGNPRPLFACESMPIQSLAKIGKDQQTVKMRVQCLNSTLDCIGWRMPEMVDAYHVADKVDIAFQPDINEWNGQRTVQLVMSDVRMHPAQDEMFTALYEEKHDGQETLADADSFYSKLVGVTFEGRQDVIPTLVAGQELVMRRESDNPYDANAIRVWTQDGRDVGHIRKEIAADIAPLMDEGVDYRCIVTAVTGGGDRSYGVNIVVIKTIVQEKIVRETQAYEEDAIRRAILGKYDYHASQQKILAELDNGKNILAIMGTGRGKSAIFQTHAAKLAMKKREMTIILYPLRALVNDQYNSLKQKMAQLGLCVYKGNGTINAQERRELYDALQEGSVDILLTTPEFLEANSESLMGTNRKIGFLVVDEGHHIAISSSRRPIYGRIRYLCEAIGDPQVLVVTATASDEVATAIQTSLAIDEIFVDRTVRSNLELVDCRDSQKKHERLMEIVGRGEKTLIFVNSRKQAFDIASALRKKLPWMEDKIGFYHAGMKNEWRVTVENWFKEGKLKTVVATSAFGEGVDLPDIRHVIQYHMPFHFTSFNQQCGRGGRDGKNSRIYLMFGSDDSRINQQILKDRAPNRETLAVLYSILKKRALDNMLSLSNAELAEEMETATGRYSSDAGVQNALKIFEELELIKRHTRGNKREIEILPTMNRKRELTESVTYSEGLAEQDAFGGFCETVLSEAGEKLLERINRPIYPQNSMSITFI